MPALTIGYGLTLIVLGLLGYFGTGMMYPDKAVSMTALIPSFIGAIALILGLVAQKPGARKHAMHGAAVVSLLAILMSLGRLISAATSGTFDITRPATLALITMMVLSIAFLAMCVRSFIAARRARLLG